MYRYQKIIKKILEVLSKHNLKKERRYIIFSDIPSMFDIHDFNSVKHILKREKLIKITGNIDKLNDPGEIEITGEGYKFLEKLEQKERDKKQDKINNSIKIAQWVTVGAMILLVVVAILQIVIINKTSLTKEHNLKVWYEGINYPIPVSIDVLTNPKIQSDGKYGYGINLCVRNLAIAKLSYVHFGIKDNDIFDSSNEGFENIGLERQCKDIRIRQKNWVKENNPNPFEDGKVYTLIFEFKGEDKNWEKPIDICTYKENQNICKKP